MPRVHDPPGDFHNSGLEGKTALAGGKDLLFLGHSGGYRLHPAPGEMGLDYGPVLICRCDLDMISEFLTVVGCDRMVHRSKQTQIDERRQT
jgi:hypothetical protein